VLRNIEETRSLFITSGAHAMFNARRITSPPLTAVTVLLTALAGGGYATDAPGTPPSASVVTLMTRNLDSAADKEVVMLTVAYPGGAASLPHRHDAQVFVYVLEGQVLMQIKGSRALTLNPGDTFYEAPDEVHLVSANGSKSVPAKLLVVMIKDKGKAVSRPAD
jgi:quercetin dioxygenase-like cupin family protein